MPRGGPMGKRGNPTDKAKDFKGAMKRLFSELKPFRILVYVALILAVLGSIMSIVTPNKLSNLTDKISEGLVVNTDNLQQLTEEVTSNFSEEKMADKIQPILGMNLSQDTVTEIMMSNEVTPEEKQQFQTQIAGMQADPTSDSMNFILELPDSILKIILPTSTYQEVEIISQDKIEFLKVMKNLANTDSKDIDKSAITAIPESIGKVLFDEIEIDGTKITSEEQIKFIQIMSTMTEESEATEIYSKIDEMPESIQEVVKPFMDIKAIRKIAITLACLYMSSALFTLIQSILMTDVANKFAKSLRSRISVKINKLPLRYFDKNSIGDILSRVTNDVDTIAQSMNQSLATLVSSTVLFLGTIIMMFYTNWIMALTAILASFIGFILMFLILGKSQKYFVARQEELGKLNGHIEEVYSGLNVVKAYNGKKLADEKFDVLNQGVYEANRKSQFLSGLMQPIMNFIGNFGYVAVCIVGALLTMNDMISFGVIVAFITYVRLFTSPLSQIAQSMTSLQSTAAACERVFEFVDEPEMKDESSLTKKLDLQEVKGNIEFDQVCFQYDNNPKPTIINFSAKAKAGQKIAIVGPTGAGKTTLVNLLMKFYDIDSGDIKIDGISTKELTRENIHELFTMVLQDTWLFDGTIRENIVYNNEEITDEQVKQICKVVGLDHFVRGLPHGLDTELSDNDTVSAGQKQLLTIARGMTKPTPFLILDEATSNVDTRTEELVQKAMDKLTEGKTSFIIAHRLSTIKNADLILVINEGNIIEQGNHEQLMEKQGFYAELYNSQFEL